jgi:hypothetical protein
VLDPPCRDFRDSRRCPSKSLLPGGTWRRSRRYLYAGSRSVSGTYEENVREWRIAFSHYEGPLGEGHRRHRHEAVLHRQAQPLDDVFRPASTGRSLGRHDDDWRPPPAGPGTKVQPALARARRSSRAGRDARGGRWGPVGSLWNRPSSFCRENRMFWTFCGTSVTAAWRTRSTCCPRRERQLGRAPLRSGWYGVRGIPLSKGGPVVRDGRWPRPCQPWNQSPSPGPQGVGQAADRHATEMLGAEAASRAGHLADFLQPLDRRSAADRATRDSSPIEVAERSSSPSSGALTAHIHGSIRRAVRQLGGVSVKSPWAFVKGRVPCAEVSIF